MPAYNVEILPDGNIKIEAEGFTGGECMSKAEALLKALGETEVTPNLEFTTNTEEMSQW
jgi:hypothetical protein